MPIDQLLFLSFFPHLSEITFAVLWSHRFVQFNTSWFPFKVWNHISNFDQQFWQWPRSAVIQISTIFSFLLEKSPVLSYCPSKLSCVSCESIGIWNVQALFSYDHPTLPSAFRSYPQNISHSNLRSSSNISPNTSGYFPGQDISSSNCFLFVRQFSATLMLGFLALTCTLPKKIIFSSLLYILYFLFIVYSMSLTFSCSLGKTFSPRKDIFF